MTDTPLPAPRASAVLRGSARGSLWISVAVHAGVFAALIVGVVTGAIGRTVQTLVQFAEFDVARRPRAARTTQPPPPPPAPPPSAAAPAARVAGHPSNRAARSSAGAPHILTGLGTGAGGFAMPSGDSNDWRGGAMGPPGGDAVRPAAPAPVPTVPTPAPTARLPVVPRVTPPDVLDESQLSQRPVIRCNGEAIAALYPQAALDNEIEADVAVEVLIGPDGSIQRVHARSDPGFGLARIAERAVLTACHVASVARDRAGQDVGARVVHHIRFALD